MAASQCLLLLVALGVCQSSIASPLPADSCVNKTLCSWEWERYEEDIGATVVKLYVNVEHYDGESHCLKDSDFGYQGSTVWVDNGCRAQFTLCTDIDACSPDRCQNGATCEDGVNAFTCVCPAGFTDPVCSTNIDDCSPDRCQNGATCEDGVNAFTCVCPAGFTDPVCSTNIDDCATAPCQHGATCTDLANDYTCACASGFWGKNCSSDLRTCYPVGEEATLYIGSVNKIKNGVPCLPWGQFGLFGSMPANFVEGILPSNFCRDTLDGGAEGAPWCYTSSGGDWDFCNVPKCEDE